MLLTVLLVILILLMVGAFPAAPWGGWHQMGPYPSGLALVLIVMLAIFFLAGRL